MSCGGQTYRAEQSSRPTALLALYETSFRRFEEASDHLDVLEAEGLAEGDPGFDAAVYQGAARMSELFALCECLAEELPGMREDCTELQEVPQRFSGDSPAV